MTSDSLSTSAILPKGPWMPFDAWVKGWGGFPPRKKFPPRGPKLMIYEYAPVCLVYRLQSTVYADAEDLFE